MKNLITYQYEGKLYHKPEFIDVSEFGIGSPIPLFGKTYIVKNIVVSILEPDGYNANYHNEQDNSEVNSTVYSQIRVILE